MRGRQKAVCLSPHHRKDRGSRNHRPGIHYAVCRCLWPHNRNEIAIALREASDVTTQSHSQENRFSTDRRAHHSLRHFLHTHVSACAIVLFRHPSVQAIRKNTHIAGTSSLTSSTSHPRTNCRSKAPTPTPPSIRRRAKDRSQDPPPGVASWTDSRVSHPNNLCVGLTLLESRVSRRNCSHRSMSPDERE